MHDALRPLRPRPELSDRVKKGKRKKKKKRNYREEMERHAGKRKATVRPSLPQRGPIPTPVPVASLNCRGPTTGQRGNEPETVQGGTGNILVCFSLRETLAIFIFYFILNLLFAPLPPFPPFPTQIGNCGANVTLYRHMLLLPCPTFPYPPPGHWPPSLINWERVRRTAHT